MRRRAALAFWLGCIVLGCGPRTAPAPRTAIVEFVRVAPDGWNFQRTPSGQPFVPLGVNYHPDGLRWSWLNADLLVVERDFQEMVELGFNAARIHLLFNEFMLGPDTPNEAALVKLDQVVRIAARHGVYLNLTGLAHYRRELIPAWFLALDDDATMAAESAFWAAIARRYAAEPTILCFDLQNEPVIAPQDTQDTVGPPFGGEAGDHYINIHFRQLSSRWTPWVHAHYGSEAALRAAWPDYPRGTESWAAIAFAGMLSSAERAADQRLFSHELAVEWTKRMVAAIREHDRRHLVTVGLTDWSLPVHDLYTSFSPYYLAPWLDFIALHTYPLGDNIDLEELTLRAGYVARPVVIEELFGYASPELETFLARSLHSASGWFSHYEGVTPGELRSHGTMRDAIWAEWLDRYSRFVREEVPPSGVSRAAGTSSVNVAISAARASATERARLVDLARMQRLKGEFLDAVLAP